MADLKWQPCCYKISIKLLVVVPMEYIFVRAKKDVITEKNNGMKNSKYKRKLSVKKWCSREVRMNLFINNKKNLTCKKY